MRVIAVANQKGGVGKTSAVVNLSAALGERGRRVLVVDLDPQANASQWLAAEAEEGVPEALLDKRPLVELVVASSAAGVDVVPSRRQLAVAERQLGTEPGGDRVLLQRIIELPDRWDFLMLDCPPQMGMLTISALMAADELLVPVEASSVALAGLDDLLETFAIIKKPGNNPGLTLTGIFVSRVDTRARIGRAILDELVSRYPEHALKAHIRDRTTMREAWSYRESILTHDPTGDATEDYRSLAAEIDTGKEAQRAAAS